MDRVSKIVQFDTIAGRLSIEAILIGEQVVNEDLLFESAEITPQLPDGMNIERCRAALIRFKQFDGHMELHLRASLSTRAIGTPCTGDRLEAIEWVSSGSLLLVGTEDAEALAQRIPSSKKSISRNVLLLLTKSNGNLSIRNQQYGARHFSFCYCGE